MNLFGLIIGGPTDQIAYLLLLLLLLLTAWAAARVSAETLHVVVLIWGPTEAACELMQLNYKGLKKVLNACKMSSRS